MQLAKRALAAVLLTLTISAASAHAAPITSIEGVITVGSLFVFGPGGSPGPVGSTASVTFFGTATEFNDVAVFPFLTFIDNFFTTEITGASVSGNFTNYSLSQPTATMKTMLLPDGVATFSITLTEASVNNLDPTTVLFRGTEVLLSAPSGFYDLSLFSQGGVFTLSQTSNANYNNVFASSFSTSFSTSGAFTQTVSPTAVVPEPASMLLLGTGLLGAGVRRCWRKR